MSLTVEAIDALVQAGATAEMLAAAVKAEIAAAEAKRSAKRAVNAERQRRKRARDRGEDQPVTRDMRDDALLRVTERDTRDPSQDKEVSPTPPSRKLNPPGDISTPAREASPTSGWEAFWQAYPRKVGKRTALKAYISALRRVTGPDPPSLILEGLRAQLAGFADREPDLIPHPATWLNRDGWDDQPDQPRNLRLVHDHRHRPEQPINRRAESRGVWADIAAEEAAARTGF